MELQADSSNELAAASSTKPDVSDKGPSISHGNAGKRSKKVSFKDPAVISTSNPQTASEDKCEHVANRLMPACPNVRIKPMMRKTNRMIKSTNDQVVDLNGGRKNDVDASEERTNVYARPELNTVLRLAERIQALEMEDFDGIAAVEERLADSQSTRRKVEKASLRPLNIGRDEEIYGGVVRLSFDEDALLLAAAEEREAKARAVLPAPRPRDPEPRLDDFQVDDAIQPEFARLPEFKLDDLDFGQAMTASRSAAYNLYRHQRMWHGFSP